MSQHLESAVAAFKALKRAEATVERAEARIHRLVVKVPQSELSEYVQCTTS